METRTVNPTVTFLEMLEDSGIHPNMPHLDQQVALLRVLKIPLDFYRYLFKVVGRDYLWVSRYNMNDEELAAIVHDEKNEIYVLYLDGAPAGYIEIDARDDKNIEISFIGLTRENIGKGLGGFLLASSIRRAWDLKPDRVHLQTCTLDHPKALETYQKFGFTPFKREETEFEVPAHWQALEFGSDHDQ